MKKIGIIRTNQNNLNSWINIFNEIDVNYEVVTSPSDLTDNSFFGLVMPGVGSFDSAISYLEESKLIKPINDCITNDMPMLAICLGFQILFDGSEEGEKKGLGFIKGFCKKFDTELTVPRMEWGTIDWTNNFELNQKIKIEDIDENERYYFVHSYFAPNNKYEIAKSHYENDYCVGI